MLQKFSPGEEFGPALEYRLTELKCTDGLRRVYLSARVRLPAGTGWIHVWTNRNREGRYCSFPFAFEVTPRARGRFSRAAASALLHQGGEVPTWTPVSDVLAARQRLQESRTNCTHHCSRCMQVFIDPPQGKCLTCQRLAQSGVPADLIPPRTPGGACARGTSTT